MRPVASPDRLAGLPRPLRVWAARRAVARLKHERAARGAEIARAPLAKAPEEAFAERRAANASAADTPPVERRAPRSALGGTIESRRAVGRRVGPPPADLASSRGDAPPADRTATGPSRERAPPLVAPVTDPITDPVAGPVIGPVDVAPRNTRSANDDTPAPRARRSDPLAGALLLCALAGSGLVGYLAGEGGRHVSEADPLALVAGDAHEAAGSPTASARPTGIASGAGVAARVAPELGAAHVRRPDGPAAVDPLWSEIGRVQAEILRLRVLFRRLADVAELDDEEFDLELEPLDLPSVREASEALDLSILALDPISERGARMARIFDERRAAHDRRVGGEVAPDTVRTSGFGLRRAPFGGRRQLHRGIDFAGPLGTPVHALADGVVAYSGPNGAYGNLVEIEHGEGYRTRYAHNQSNLVAVGDRVAKGEAVATLGSSGRSTGPHVHVEVRRDGVAVDPAAYVR